MGSPANQYYFQLKSTRAPGCGGHYEPFQTGAQLKYTISGMSCIFHERERLLWTSPHSDPTPRDMKDGKSGGFLIEEKPPAEALLPQFSAALILERVS